MAKGKSQFLASAPNVFDPLDDYKGHRYTEDQGTILDDEQRLFYEENGYIVIRGLVPQKALDLYRKRFVEICHGVDVPPGITVMKDVALRDKPGVDPEFVVNKLQDYQFDDTLFTYCYMPQVLDYVQSIIGQDIMAMHTMLINKPPDPGTLTSRHPLHQDLYYFPFRPADSIVCSWTAMEPVTRANGCLVVIPGSHKLGKLLAHGYPQWQGGVNKMYHGIMEEVDTSSLVHLEMAPGDTVFFHPLLIHGSGANKTNGYRKAISCHFANARCAYIEVSGTNQESIGKEIVDTAARKFGGAISFQEIWQAKAKLVRGLKSNL